MSLIQGNSIEGGAGYEIQKSLRFRASASAYLSRTPTVAGNRKTWTWSGWVKRGSIGSSQSQVLFMGGNTTNDYTLSLNFSAIDDRLVVRTYGVTLVGTSAVYRDPSAWYHISLSVDTTQATNNLKLYVNGVQVGSYSISQHWEFLVNAAAAHALGWQSVGWGFTHFDGYLSEINFIDGQALTPSSFGQFDPVTGVWIPKKYTGTYGTNGFYLPFNDGSSLANLTADKSGNGNNWTANNISLTAGSSYDWMDDTPTNNFCTLNPLSSVGSSYHNVYGGNLNWQTNTSVGGSSYNATGMTFSGAPSSGLWYYEFVVNQINAANTGYIYHLLANCYIWWVYGGTYQIVGSNGTTSIGSISSGDVIQVAVDSTNGKMWYGRNGTWYTVSGTPDPAAGTGASSTFTPTSDPTYFNIQGRTGNVVQDVSFNFGQRPFTYSPPTGFKALCTKNLPEVPASLLDPTDHHIDITVTKSGDTNFTLPWDASVYDTFFEIKRRDAIGDWYQIDGLRGYDKILKSNSTAAETTDANVLGVSGTTCTLKSTLPNGVYIISATKAGLSSARQTNTDGSITSTVSRNVASGFSIVTWAGSGSASATVGHGLGKVLGMEVVKNRSGNYSWPVLHASLPTNGNVFLNLTQAYQTTYSDGGLVNPTTSSTFTFTTTSTLGQVNASGSNYVAYCYADSAIQKSFSYTGNGSTDGPYVNLGFKCGRTLWKRSSGGSSNWSVLDSARDTFNVADNPLLPNSDVAEQTSTPTAYAHADLLALSMKVRGNSSDINNSGSDTYIGHAWAAVTGKYSNAR